MTIIAAFPQVTHACGCESISLDELYLRAAFIFVGEVIAAENIKDDGKIHIRFDVLEMIRGDQKVLPAAITVYPGSCGFPVVIGGYYLILANADGQTNICDYSHAIEDFNYGADPDVVRLRERARQDSGQQD